jgi:DNA adenine methylase
MRRTKIRPPYKVEGNKYHVCDWIIGHLPEDYVDYIYIEPFAGAASVLLNKLPSVEEAIGDLDPGIVQMIRAIRDQPAEFIAAVKKVSQTEDSFRAYLDGKPEDEMGHAVKEFALRLLSRSGCKKTYAPANRSEIGTRWLKLASERLQRVYIFEKPALEVLKAFNTPDVIVYCDPPPMPETRQARKNPLEMSAEDHIDLAHVLKTFRGQVLLSGRASPLYNRMFKTWRCVKTKKQAKVEERECLWMNY